MAPSRWWGGAIRISTNRLELGHTRRMHAALARRVAVTLGLALIVAAAVLMVWPLHANGVRGNALQPRYTSFGWYSYAAVPARPTHADFIRAGITVPQDVVHDRRVLSAELAGGGVVLLIGAGIAFARRRPATATSPRAH